MAHRAVSADMRIPFKRGQGLTTPERSALMGRVRQAKTAPEQAVAAWLRARHVGYRRNVRALPGRPDFANKSAGFAIFVHGCFWHRHPGCTRATTPTRNRTFWTDKFAANIARDATRSSQLEGRGLRTFTVWECETEDDKLLDEKLAPLLDRPSLLAEKVATLPTEPRRRLGADGRRDPSGQRTTVGCARGARALAHARSEGAGS